MRSTDKQTLRRTLAVLEPEVHPMSTGVRLVQVVGFDADGQVLVDLSSADGPVCAVGIVPLTLADIGSRVVVVFEQDTRRPIVLGRVQERQMSDGVGVKVDGERVVIKAEREIELRCGEASIVLSRSGKVLIRGNYVLSRSRGANKIKGAFVDIN